MAKALQNVRVAVADVETRLSEGAVLPKKMAPIETAKLTKIRICVFSAKSVEK